MDEHQSTNDYGPALYFNWKLKEKGGQPVRIVEYPLYTDACKIESTFNTNKSPYILSNPDVITNKNILLPRIILQIEEFNYFGRNITNPKKFYIDFYLINNIPDQVAVILSLILGIRIRAGTESRIFLTGNIDRGKPVHNYIDLEPAQINLIKGKAVLPTILKNIDNSNGAFSLEMVNPFFSSFNSLNVQQAELIIRAAKLYRDALWIADSEPQLSIILLISSIEGLLEYFWDNFKNEYNCKFTISKAFRNFLIKYLPDPPLKRCHSVNQIKWEKLYGNSNGNPLSKMYDFRSKLLHNGIPFPLDFLKPNSLWTGESNEDYRYEKSITTSICNQNIELSPMSLSIFEYIVRNSILNWWKNIIP